MRSWLSSTTTVLSLLDNRAFRKGGNALRLFCLHATSTCDRMSLHPIPARIKMRVRDTSFGVQQGGLTMRTLAFGAVALLSGTLLSTAASAQCPAAGNDTGCGALITITQTGANVTPTGQGPYDGSDDTLIGVVNNIPVCTPLTSNSQLPCGISIYSLDLTSTQNICGFDGDGVNGYLNISNNAKDGTGYGGPNAYFTNIAPSGNSCRVNFIKPIPPGGKTDFFSLENALKSSTTTPCALLLTNSLKGANNNGTRNPPPVGNAPNSVPPTNPGGQNVGIRATFVPQGNDPNTGMPYTLAAAATACGFIEWDWQQLITQWPSPSNLFADAPCSPKDAAGNSIGLVAPPSFNDIPSCGYTYFFAPPNNLTRPYNNPQATYYNASRMNEAFALNTHKNTSASPNYLAFFDSPNDPLLPAGQTMNFTTQLVGLQGPDIAHAAVVPTGIGVVWTSNHKGATGGVTVSVGDSEANADATGAGGPTIVSVSQTPTYTGTGVSGINGSNNIFAPTSLLAAVLPESRSAQVNDPTEGVVTAFATIINTGTTTATSCSIAPATSVPVTFHYRPTNPTTNAVIGTLDTPIDIPAGQSQSFVFGLTATAGVTPTDVALNFSCTNTAPAPIVTGLNTLLYSGSTTPVPDLIALVGTHQNDGIVHVTTPAQSNFVVATDNLGSGDTITVAANTGSATLPVTITTCQTTPSTGVCLQTPAATVATPVATNATPTFAFFVTASSTVAFDPANNRIFVTFTDSKGAVRGETSLAVETQ
jgi:hypothetical protein